MKHLLQPGGPLLDAAAAACFYHLIAGARRSRNYEYAHCNEFGYFFEPFIHKWVAFDNRAGDCYVEICDSSKEAEKLLRDGEELLAA